MPKRIVVLLSVLILLAAVVAGCGGTTQATQDPGPVAAEPGTALQITGRVATQVGWSEEELEAMDRVTVQYTNRDGETTEHTGVPVSTLLQLASPQQDPTGLVFVADDGYTAQATLADVQACGECIVAFRDGGGFNLVMPGFPGSLQVRGVIEIQVQSESAAPSTAGQPSSPAGPPIEVVDAAGRTVELDGLPQRIVVIGRGPYMALHLLYMFPEGRERLVGMERRGNTASDFLPLVDPTFNDKIALEANAGPEQIAVLQPDLVLMKSTAVEQMSESLGQLGIPVVYLGLESPEQFFQDVTNLGVLLGNEERAAEIVGFYQARLERIRQSTEGLAESERPRALVLEYSDRGGEVAVQVPAQSWMQTIQVQTVGGNPVWLEEVQVTDGWTVVNLEQIALWDPDKIFVVVSYTLDPAEVIAALKADPRWSALTAVQNDEIYAFPSDLYGWDTPEPRWMLGMTWLATRMHPTRFTDVDVNEEIYQFFDELYGMDQSAVDASIMPVIHLDVR